VTAETPSTSNQRRATPTATSGLLSVSPRRISILRPKTSPPKSFAAISAATTEPGPPESM
jgi:hypothetical protein